MKNCTVLSEAEHQPLRTSKSPVLFGARHNSSPVKSKSFNRSKEQISADTAATEFINMSN